MRRRPESASLTIDTLERRKNLVTTLVEAVEREILEGRLKPGDRLPPETALAASAGVSRTVVREAVAALKAANLVETRQGAGAFVLSPMARLNIPSGGVRRATVEEILAILELRLAVEVEAAALAAARRTDDDIAAIDAAIASMGEEAIAAGEAVEPDLAFHQALAAATRNRYFKEFLDNLGELAIPRRHLARAAIDTSDLRPHFARVRAEHQAIRNAVQARDSALAAAAMRAHLAGSRARYAELIKTGGEGRS